MRGEALLKILSTEKLRESLVRQALPLSLLLLLPVYSEMGKRDSHYRKDSSVLFQKKAASRQISLTMF